MSGQRIFLNNGQPNLVQTDLMVVSDMLGLVKRLLYTIQTFFVELDLSQNCKLSLTLERVSLVLFASHAPKTLVLLQNCLQQNHCNVHRTPLRKPSPYRGGEFVCPYEPGSCIVWSHVLLVGTPMANWSQARGQTKNSSKGPQKERKRPSPEEARVPHLEPGPEGGPTSVRLVVGHATEPGQAQPEEAMCLPPLLYPVGSPSTGRTAELGLMRSVQALGVEGLSWLTS